uniref:Putative secreted protein n=1 Tax=Ixodes ricinus TaxID=34613 RepID=A0A6B0U1R4_IXORI
MPVLFPELAQLGLRLLKLVHHLSLLLLEPVCEAPEPEGLLLQGQLLLLQRVQPGSAPVQLGARLPLLATQSIL